jgi:hypothetical protein
MGRLISALLLIALAAVELAACSSDQTSRGIYEGLRRREERIDVPGEGPPGGAELRRVPALAAAAAGLGHRYDSHQARRVAFTLAHQRQNG